jgi:hypothetical protein
MAAQLDRLHRRIRTLLICHHDAPLDHESIARWLASFSIPSGIVVINETSQQMRLRVRREWKRVGSLGFIDILGFKLYYKLFLRKRDAGWTQQQLKLLSQRYPEVNSPVMHTRTPNSDEVETFIREAEPDIVMARCKLLLKKTLFGIPKRGTFVMHPGICPEYRNAHGCFWALARCDPGHVGMTLLKMPCIRLLLLSVR